MITKTTLRQQAQQTFKDNQTQIMESLQITELQHNKHLFESGMQFLAKMFASGEADPDFKVLAQHKQFWNWYKTEWALAQKKWLVNANTFELMQLSIERRLYLQHMEFRCVLSKSIYDSFDTWLDLSFKALMNGLPARTKK